MGEKKSGAVKAIDGKQCIFPFIYKGQTYEGCTKAGGAPKVWCATKTTADGHFITHKWDYCEDSNRGFHCLKVKTGTESDNHGVLYMTVDFGKGPYAVPSETHSYASGQTVIEECFDSEIKNITVWNDTNDCWVGTIELSAKYGAEYQNATCTDCTNRPPVDSRGRNVIAVDGNNDWDTPAARCSGGKRCNISIPTVAPTGTVATPTNLLGSNREFHCLKVKTGIESHNQGILYMDVDSGKGPVALPWTSEKHFFVRGQTVIEKCFENEIKSIAVWNDTNNCWVGTIELSAEYGADYQNATCADCTNRPSALKPGRNVIAVDGNNDWHTPAARCSLGRHCNITVEPVKTIDGKQCIFPFIYKGKTYEGCTKEGASEFWCATRTTDGKNFITHNWNFCKVLLKL